MDRSKQMLQIKEAYEALELFHPTFVENEGAIFLASELPVDSIEFSSFSDLTEAECFYNHVHILDRFQHAAALALNGSETNDWDKSHADFQYGCAVGKVVACLWSRKLAVDFPLYRFRVYYTEADNPTVRFHRVHDGEANWLDEEDWLSDIAQGKVIVYDTGPVVIE